jgi:hypothetical protein
MQAMNVNVNEEDTMISTATFFIETACVTGITPLDSDALIRRVRAPRASSRRAAPAVTGPDERFVEELLATFTDRWEW